MGYQCHRPPTHRERSAGSRDRRPAAGGRARWLPGAHQVSCRARSSGEGREDIAWTPPPPGTKTTAVRFKRIAHFPDGRDRPHCRFAEYVPGFARDAESKASKPNPGRWRGEPSTAQLHCAAITLSSAGLCFHMGAGSTVKKVPGLCFNTGAPSLWDAL